MSLSVKSDSDFTRQFSDRVKELDQGYVICL